MGLFSRSKDPETEAAAPAPAESAKVAAPAARPDRQEPSAPASTALPSSPAPAPAPPTPPPAPVAAPDPAAQALLKDLAVKIGALAGSAEAERDAVKKFTNKVEKMEDRLEMFQILFESLSLKYNPFLGKSEPDAFEGQTLLPETQAPQVAVSLPAEEAGPAPSAHAPHAVASDGNGYHAAPPPPSAANAVSARLAAPAVHAVHAAPAHPAPAQLAPPRRVAQHPYPWGDHPLQGARESYLALCWFEHLYKHVPPKLGVQILDHYLALGWLTPEAHDWLRSLALAIAPPIEPAANEAHHHKPLTSLQMVRLHKSSLRFFDHVFRFSLDHNEARHLKRAVGGIIERG